jgi:23S rRNA (guanosine2251-2'-O)-methyltransferase
MEHLEGRESVAAALRAYRRRFEVILVSHSTHEEKLEEVLTLAAERGVAVRRVDRKELDAMTHGATHGGVVAVVSERPRTSEKDLLELVDGLKEPALILVLEGVEDARNLGFTLRTAEAMGVHAVMIKKHLWDLDGVEIARPASGAYERLPLVQFEDVELLKKLQGRGLRLYGCIAGAKRAMHDVPLNEPAILAIGGEKRGLSGAIRSVCDRLITIPTVGGASSLSLSHAGAIVMAEAMRQRRAMNAPTVEKQ